MRRLALSSFPFAWPFALLFALPVSAESLPPSANQPGQAIVREPIVLVQQPTAQQPAAAQAQPAATPDQRQAQTVVQTKLVNPLSEKEAARTRFSRVLRPTPIMRVRVTDPQPQQDARGSAYMTFAVDSCNRFVPGKGDCWQQAAITGCVYPQSGQVFVQRGDQFFPADVMLGKKADSASNVCQSSAAAAAPTLARAS